MASACAAFCDKIAIVLKHVEVIVLNNALDFPGGVLVSGRNAEVDGLTFELSGLPVGREIIYQPALHLGVAHVEGCGGCAETSLRPVHPKTEPNPAAMCRIGNGG